MVLYTTLILILLMKREKTPLLSTPTGVSLGGSPTPTTLRGFSDDIHECACVKEVLDVIGSLVEQLLDHISRSAAERGSDGLGDSIGKADALDSRGVGV